MFNWANVWKSHFTTSSNLTYALPVRNTVMKLGSARLHIATTVSVYCWEFACNVIAFTVSPLFLHLALSLSPCTASPLPITVYLCFSRVCMKLNLPVFLLLPPPFVSIAPPMLMACTGRNAVVICQSPAGKFASFDVRGWGWGGEWCEYERKRVGRDGTYPWQWVPSLGSVICVRVCFCFAWITTTHEVSSSHVVYLCTVPTSL